MKAMNYAQIRAFHSVATQGSYTKAAQKMRVSQPTLSTQVAKLETHYAVKLFQRQGRGVTLTETGKRLLRVTQCFFAVENEARQVLQNARGLMSGELRVYADAPYLVVPILAQFKRLHPGIHFSLSFGNSAQILQSLFDRQCDIIVMPDLHTERRLHVRALRRAELVGFVAKNHPLASRTQITLKDFAAHCVILREKGSTTRRILERALDEEGIVPADNLTVGTREAVREAVACGLGVGVIFAKEIGQDPRLKALRFYTKTLETTDYAACLSEQQDAPLVKGFMDLIHATAQNPIEGPETT